MGLLPSLIPFTIAALVLSLPMMTHLYQKVQA
jgi:hypothetical protein